MEWALVIAVIAIIVSILLTYWRSMGTKKQRVLMEQQLEHQMEELRVLRELVESFNRLTASYDLELESMRTQLLLTSGEAIETGEVKDEVTVAAEIEMEREKQKAEKKLQKEEVKRIKKRLKALKKGEKG